MILSIAVASIAINLPFTAHAVGNDPPGICSELPRPAKRSIALKLRGFTARVAMRSLTRNALVALLPIARSMTEPPYLVISPESDSGNYDGRWRDPWMLSFFIRCRSVFG